MRCTLQVVLIVVLFLCFSIGIKGFSDEDEAELLRIAQSDMSEVPLRSTTPPAPEDPEEVIDLSTVFQNHHEVTGCG